MLCPNDNIEMHQVTIVSHYGGPIFVDQCEKCGGIWFDKSELFRAKQGEAEKIEALNAEILRTSSMIEHPNLICPRDGAAMQRFTDKYFPQDIVLVCCPSCHGFWLNRGIFTKYQQFRQELMRSKRKSPQDEKLGKTVAYLVKSCESGHSPEALERLREFLSISAGRTENSDYSSNILNNPEVATVEAIADFLATTITNLLMPGWKC
jgi:Zn-finger nucleic acid-binding protein